MMNSTSVSGAFRPGIYTHYKGNEYEAYELVIHSETLESMVLYRPTYGEKKLWVRPLDMFLEQVEINGEKIDRFQWVKPISEKASSDG